MTLSNPLFKYSLIQALIDFSFQEKWKAYYKKGINSSFDSSRFTFPVMFHYIRNNSTLQQTTKISQN